MSGFTDKVDVENKSVVIRTLAAVSIYVNVAFLLIHILIRMGFLMKGVKEPSKELERLIESGARKADIGSICLVESLFIALIDFVITLLVSGVLCVALNAYVQLPLFTVGVLPFIGLFILCFGSAALATFLPVRKVVRSNR